MKNREQSKYFLKYHEQDPMKVGMSKEQLEEYKQIYTKTKEQLKKEPNDTFEKFVEAAAYDTTYDIISCHKKDEFLELCNLLRKNNGFNHSYSIDQYRQFYIHFIQ